MYRFERIGRTKAGKLLEGAAWAREVADYINSKHPQASVQVCSEVFDDIQTIHWYSDFPDFATFEEINTKLMADQDYRTLVNKGAQECCIDGNFQDKLMRFI